MSYTLTRARWVMTEVGTNLRIEKYSWHLNEGDFTTFAKQERIKGLECKPTLELRICGVSTVHHVNDNLYSEVKHAREHGYPGVWKEIDEEAVCV